MSNAVDRRTVTMAVICSNQFSFRFKVKSALAYHLIAGRELAMFAEKDNLKVTSR